MAKQKGVARQRFGEHRREKMIETVQSHGQQAELYKVPSIFPGEYIYRLSFAGRNYYAPTQPAAHQLFHGLVSDLTTQRAA